MAEAIEQAIEQAEEAEDTEKLLSLIATCTEKRSVCGVEDENQDQEEAEDWETPTEAALDAYYRLTKGPGGDHGHGVAVVHSCLNAWREEEAIVEVGLGCLANVVGSPLAASSITDVPALVVALMRAHPTEGTIQEQACLVLEGLAKAAADSSEESKESIRGTDGLREEVSAAVGRITNQRNKAYPKRVAVALRFELISA